ncbi:NAD(P)-dependent oxidoreductase [Paenirhodobacter sp.]|uniref:NAD(P)-dependent oxidoreductase n=1 Tax=Paenirhodobacter sp. TaxID=1965326 RepID=UPI003B5021BB
MSQPPPPEAGTDYVSDLDALIACADTLSLNLPGARFARMKPAAIFVNPARGSLVDKEAPIGALASGQLAGLDVFRNEPAYGLHRCQRAEHRVDHPVAGATGWN